MTKGFVTKGVAPGGVARAGLPDTRERLANRSHREVNQMRVLSKPRLHRFAVLLEIQLTPVHIQYNKSDDTTRDHTNTRTIKSRNTCPHSP
jgi:hypothetical protein